MLNFRFVLIMKQKGLRSSQAESGVELIVLAQVVSFSWWSYPNLLVVKPCCDINFYPDPQERNTSVINISYQRNHR